MPAAVALGGVASLQPLPEAELVLPPPALDVLSLAHAASDTTLVSAIAATATPRIRRTVCRPLPASTSSDAPTPLSVSVPPRRNGTSRSREADTGHGPCNRIVDPLGRIVGKR
ncbi:hypothetical protein GCM10018954_039680 [Kutzneria kofuensis]